LVLSSIVDISARKQAEAEARRHVEELAHLTRVTTLSELSGSLAHELNQPLAIILSNAQAAQRLLVQSPPDVTEVRSILTDIVSEDRRAGEVIQRLRALFKRGETMLLPLSLNDVIREVLDLTNADLIQRGVTVVCELAGELPPISGDRVQLQQVVLNLILNAADAMSANAPRARPLHITTAQYDRMVRASLRDAGCGLPADGARLFEPFFTTKPQGLGMGLAICRSIISAHHGRLWAESHPECGAIFHLELPAM
jgi:C4-dicarboxylate-specific signal transduction histidine kinase